MKNKREKEVDDALNKMPNTIEKYYQNVSRKDIAEEVKKAKREEVMDQGRSNICIKFFFLN